MKVLVILLSLAVSLLGTVPASDAKPIEFVFTAIVASAEPEFPTVHPGDLVVGKYFFESNTADSDPNPGRGAYFSAGTFDVKIGTLTFRFPLSEIEVLDNYFGSQDRYTVVAQSGNTLLELTLLDSANQNPFTNDSLPLVPPPLSKFDDSRHFQVFLRNPPNPDFIPKINADVTTLVAPEPSALVLFVSGLAGLAGVAGWRKRGPLPR